MRAFTQVVNVLRNEALTASQINRFSKEFPLGEGWLGMIISLDISLTVGTGTTPVSEGNLEIIKNILLKSDKDGMHVNCPGRGLYYLAYAKTGRVPLLTAMAASDGHYYTAIPILFSNPYLNVSNDSILDTSRYQSIELEILLGSLADCLGTVGTATATYALSVDVIRTKGALPAKAKPIVYPYVSSLPSVNPANQQFISLERSTDLALLMVLAHSANSATTGEPFSGVSNNDVIGRMSIEDNNEIIFNERDEDQIRCENQTLLGLENVTGWYGFSFASEGSIYNAYATGDKTRLDLKWVNDTLSTSGVSVLIDGVRKLK